MSEEIIRIKSVTQLHEMFGYEKPKHPLVSVVDVTKVNVSPEWIGQRLAIDLYYVGLKSAECEVQYGRNQYDFEEGVLSFTAPKQIITITSSQEFDLESGWMLFFHSDLIRTTPLGDNMDIYSFFSYEVYEALHLSDSEKQILNDCIKKIRQSTTNVSTITARELWFRVLSYYSTIVCASMKDNLIPELPKIRISLPELNPS